MKTPAKVAVGLATIWPLVYMFVFFGFIGLMMVIGMSGNNDKELSPPMAAGMIAIFGLHFVTIFWSLGVMAFYIINLFQNKRVANDMKAVWAVVLLLGGMVACPIYWYLYIWRDDIVPPKE